MDSGTPVENNLKNKTLRKVLCKCGRPVFITTTRDDVAINDFAKILADLEETLPSTWMVEKALSVDP